MRTIDILDFTLLYMPSCNDFRPIQDKRFVDLLGDTIWDKQDYSLLGNYIGEKRLWTLTEVEKGVFEITPGIKLRNHIELIGYILTDIPYHRNDISTLKVRFMLD